jgi:hypothetical protein
MTSLVGVGRPKLHHPHMPGIQGGDQPPDAPTFAGSVPALEQDAKRGSQLRTSDEAAHLESKCQKPSLGLSDPSLTLGSSELQSKVCVIQGRHGEILSGRVTRQ